MTNYRLHICECDVPQFKYCFTCGAVLKTEGDTLTCHKSWVHCRLFIEECIKNKDKDCEHVISIE